MAFQRSHQICGLALFCALALAGCGAVEQVKSSILPTPTPLPTPTAQPYVGHVGQRTAYNGWAVTVTNVLRSSLNPVEIVPVASRPDEKYDYISMDVAVERTIDERGSVYGDDFSLVDSDGNEIKNDSLIHNWATMGGDVYFGTAATDRIAFRLPRTSQSPTLRFSPWPSIPEPLEVALDQMKEPRRIDLQEAIELGLLTAGVRGVSLESIEVELSLEVDEAFELSILPGTTFLAPSPDLQTMVVRRQVFVFLEEKDEASLEVSVACANMRLEAPSGGETYIVAIEPPAEELRKLLGLPEFQDSSFRLQQFAIWTITDNPARNHYVGLGAGGEGSPPSITELQTIAGWFEVAGISLDGYPALRQ
jgi:hypothetical protein